MNNNECIICYETKDAINYNHKCGKYKIHKSCLYDWLSSHNDQCITCREELNMGDFILTNNDNEELEFNLPKEVILEIQNDTDNVYNTNELSDSTDIRIDDPIICKHKWKMSLIFLFCLFISFMISVNTNKK